MLFHSLYSLFVFLVHIFIKYIPLYFAAVSANCRTISIFGANRLVVSCLRLSAKNSVALDLCVLIGWRPGFDVIISRCSAIIGRNKELFHKHLVKFLYAMPAVRDWNIFIVVIINLLVSKVTRHQFAVHSSIGMSGLSRLNIRFFASPQITESD